MVGHLAGHHLPLSLLADIQHQQQQKQSQSFAASYVRCSAARSIFRWTASIFTGHWLYKMAYTPCTCHFGKGESHATSTRGSFLCAGSPMSHMTGMRISAVSGGFFMLIF